MLADFLSALSASASVQMLVGDTMPLRLTSARSWTAMEAAAKAALTASGNGHLTL